MYLKAAGSAERRGATEHRRRLLDGLTAPSSSSAPGNGLNFPHYPPAVTEVDRDRARADAARPRPAEPRPGAPVPVRVLRRRRRRAAARGRKRRRGRRQPRALLGPRPGPRARRAASRPAPRRRAALLRARHPPLPTEAPAAPGRRPQRPVAEDRRRLPPRSRHRRRDRAAPAFTIQVKRADHVRRVGVRA